MTSLVAGAGNPRSPKLPAAALAWQPARPTAGVSSLGARGMRAPPARVAAPDGALGLLRVPEEERANKRELTASPSPPTGGGFGGGLASPRNRREGLVGARGVSGLLPPPRGFWLLPPTAEGREWVLPSPRDHGGGEASWLLPFPPQGWGWAGRAAPRPWAEGGFRPLPAQEARGARRAGAAARAARRSQELTLLAGGSCSRGTSGSGLRPGPRPAGRRYLPGMLAAPRASGARFWGQPAPPRAPPPAPGPAAGGRRPAGFLAPPSLAAGVAPGQACGPATGPERAPGPGFLPRGRRPQAPAARPCRREGKLRPGGVQRLARGRAALPGGVDAADADFNMKIKSEKSERDKACRDAYHTRCVVSAWLGARLWPKLRGPPGTQS